MTIFREQEDLRGRPLPPKQLSLYEVFKIECTESGSIEELTHIAKKLCEIAEKLMGADLTQEVLNETYVSGLYYKEEE